MKATWCQLKKLNFSKKFFLKKVKLFLDLAGCFDYSLFRHERHRYIIKNRPRRNLCGRRRSTRRIRAVLRRIKQRGNRRAGRGDDRTRAKNARRRENAGVG